MKIIVSQKLYYMVTGMMPADKKIHDIDNLKESKIVEVRENPEKGSVIIGIKEDFVIDVATAVLAFAAPFAGMLTASYALGETLGRKLDEIYKKHTTAKENTEPDCNKEDMEA